MNKTLLILTILLLFSPMTIAQNKDIEAKIDALLEKMTLEEKVGQMNQYTGFFDPTGPTPKDGNNKYKYEHVKSGKVGSMLNVRGVKQVRELQKIAVENSRLGIPLIFGLDVIHGFKTISPIPLAEAASWDLEAIEKSARIAATEATASGINWTFAPMVDIYRDARWGRVMEGAGEDTYLGSKIGVARVKGFQGEDLKATNTMAACAKHFASYGFAESGRDYNTVDVGMSTLYNVILPPFKAISDAGVMTFMNAFNELNGVPATGDAFLQRDILKGEWGFKGFVVSDWASIAEMKSHGFAKDDAHAATMALNAGSDMDMEAHIYIHHLKNLAETDKIKMEHIDDAVRRILRVKFELGLFDDPYLYCNEEREKTLLNHADHHEAALDMAKKSIVLLKNEKNVLPLPKEGKKIALIGALAANKNSSLGNWRFDGEDHSAISVLEGMQARKGNEIIYSEGVKLNTNQPQFYSNIFINQEDRTGMKEAIEAAKTADIVVMVLGEHGFQSGEGRSRANLQLPGLQQELLEAVHAVNPNIVLVLMNGRPLAITWADENVPAIVEAWQLGSQTGSAVAEVLYGDYNPSGKLPMTFPRSVGQVPIYYNHKNTGRPGPKTKDEDVFWSGYADEKHTPLYPFGYGLSYTSFEYSDLETSVDSEKREVKISVKVKNTGKLEGEEVVQLYIHDLIATLTRPIKELKGFDKIELKADESKMVEFTLTEKELGFYDNQGKFVVEAGDFEVMIGGSSETVLKEGFELK
ncbi:MAG: beta-glucosidase BglX [Chitinophagales bacterium]